MTERKKDCAAHRLSQIAAEAAVETLMKGMPAMILKIVSDVLDAYAGQRVPKRTAAKRAIRNQHIREQAAAGRDVETLAMAFKLSKSQIMRILKHHAKSESD